MEEGHVGQDVLWGSQERQPGLGSLAVWQGKAALWVLSVTRAHTFLQKALPQGRKHETVFPKTCPGNTNPTKAVSRKRIEER